MQRPPSKEQIAGFLAEFDAGHRTYWTHTDVAFMVAAYRYQESVLQGMQEDLSDAGRELREMVAEHQAELRRQAEDLW
jgi:hypothetical protein